MRVQWPFLLLSLVFLLPPMPLSGALHKYVMSARRNPSASVPALFRCWQNWADLIRAGAGVYLLMEYAIQVDRQVKGAGMKALLLEGTVLAAALLFQLARIGPGLQLVAPIFYLCGLTLVLAGYVPGGFAVFVGWMFAIGGKRPAYQLPTMGVALGLSGYILSGPIFLLLLNCVLIFGPLLLSFLFQKPLAFVAGEWHSPAPESGATSSSGAKVS